MMCPICGSQNVTVQAVTETNLRIKKRGAIWWIFVGWWWVPIKWICFFGPALFIKIFRPKNYQTKSKHEAMCICQSCGHMWKA